jgi:hypothetical protein
MFNRGWRHSHHDESWQYLEHAKTGERKAVPRGNPITLRCDTNWLYRRPGVARPDPDS